MRVDTTDDTGKPNGYIRTLWNCLEQYWRPDQVYLAVIAPLSQKGPHLHKKRVGRFFCIRGSVEIIRRTPAGAYIREVIDADRNSAYVEVPTGHAVALINSGLEDAYLLNMPSPAWSPTDQDEWPVENWNPPFKDRLV